jgi:uncharacterized protein YbbC (DUF1343 family)
MAAKPHRRAVCAGLLGGGLGFGTLAKANTRGGGVITGAAALAADGFSPLRGKRVGLLTNRTGRVGEAHLVDLMAGAPGLRLSAILAPEHGLRGAVEAGRPVANARDPKTGLPIFSLYGATRAPTPGMLADIDVLVFDIQDIGARFYTYISTMGLAMQAAARAGIPFIVLDRPNPIGGLDVAGFTMEPGLRSFIGQYPMPVVHGLTVGELARMIQGERWLDGLDRLDLEIVPVTGWLRSQRFPATGLPWTPTSPNIPTFDAALVYPGIGMVGETLVNEGRGTPTPFSLVGAPWLDAPRLAAELSRGRLPGAMFQTALYTPRPIADVAANPRFAGAQVAAVRIVPKDSATYRPLDVGMHVLAGLRDQARERNLPLFHENLRTFHAVAGTTRLHRLLIEGARGSDIVAEWRGDVARFRERRRPYLLYA